MSLLNYEAGRRLYFGHYMTNDSLDDNTIEIDIDRLEID